MSLKEPRLRIPVALTVAIIAAGAAVYGCKNQCTVSSAAGGGPNNPDGGQAGAGGTPDCATTATNTNTDLG